MKKIFTFLFALSLFLLVGCGNKVKTPTLKEGAYYDKNNMHNGESLERMTLKNNNVERITCGANAGCSLFKGFYLIENETLAVTLTHYNDEIDGWTELGEYEKIEYKITKENEFTKDESVFVLKEENEGQKTSDQVTKLEINLEKGNESFELDKLKLEFIGSVYSECGEDCYLYSLNIKYDDKEVGKGFFNDEENFRIFSKNMTASFTVYKIDEIYILVSNVGSQCYPENILIFNTEGKTLEMYSNADITVDNKNISIEVSPSHNCMGEPEFKYNFEISGLELKER